MNSASVSYDNHGALDRCGDQQSSPAPFDRNAFAAKEKTQCGGLVRGFPKEADIVLKALMKKLSPRFQLFTGVQELRKGNAILQAREHERLIEQVREHAPDNIAACGYKVYSQNDEDGIIDAIFRRVASNGVFVEIGVQNGAECNSLLLLLKGWRGVWIEGSEAYCREIERALGRRAFPPRFKVEQAFVRRDNIVGLIRDAMSFLETQELDFFSIDVDGNDRHLLEELIGADVRPKVVCVEYNAKFPPPVAVTVIYDPDHVWDQTDYMGSSLQSLVDLLAPVGYRLLTCNVPGINAFFIREDLAKLFPALPIEQLYQPFRLYLSPIASAQPPSLGYLRNRLLEGSGVP